MGIAPVRISNGTILPANPSTHEAWAVVDHASDFAVVPEPAALLLLATFLVPTVTRFWALHFREDCYKRK